MKGILERCWRAIPSWSASYEDDTIQRREGFLGKLRHLVWSKEAIQREHLLEWVSKKIPDFDIKDLNVNWQDGRALCALLETILPGSCPKCYLLVPEEGFHNCMLALHVAHRYFGIPEDTITAEEIAAGSGKNKLELLLLALKAFSDERDLLDERSRQEANDRVAQTIVAKGSGLLGGIVGRRSRCTIFVPHEHLNEVLELGVEILGPNNEFCSEKVRSLPMRETGVLPKQRSTDNEELPSILFHHQCVTEGHVLISFVPQTAGMHTISIQWQGSHINDSPFIVKVSPGRALHHRQGSMSWSEPGDIIHRSYRNSTSSDHSVNSSDQAMDVPLPKGHGGSDPSSRSLSPATAFAQQATVMRRRILKRVISTKDGNEIILHDASCSSGGSREGSPEVLKMNKGKHLKQRGSKEKLRRTFALPVGAKNIVGQVSGNSTENKDSDKEIGSYNSRFQDLKLTSLSHDEVRYVPERPSVYRHFSDPIKKTEPKKIEPQSESTKIKEIEKLKSKITDIKDSPLKVLQSDSLHKTCYYMANNTIFQTLASVNSTDDPNAITKVPVRATRSYPLLRKTYTAIELDPEDTRTPDDIETVTILMQKRRKRFSLEGSGLSNSLELFQTKHGIVNSNPALTVVLSGGSVEDDSNGGASVEKRDNGYKNRGATCARDPSPTEKSESSDCSGDSRKFDSEDLKPYSGLDKSTQASYLDIKTETGWVRKNESGDGNCRAVMRRVPVYVDSLQPGSPGYDQYMMGSHCQNQEDLNSERQIGSGNLIQGKCSGPIVDSFNGVEDSGVVVDSPSESYISRSSNITLQNVSLSRYMSGMPRVLRPSDTFNMTRNPLRHSSSTTSSEHKINQNGSRNKGPVHSTTNRKQINKARGKRKRHQAVFSKLRRRKSSSTSASKGTGTTDASSRSRRSRRPGPPKWNSLTSRGSFDTSLSIDDETFVKDVGLDEHLDSDNFVETEEVQNTYATFEESKNNSKDDQDNLDRFAPALPPEVLLQDTLASPSDMELSHLAALFGETFGSGSLQSQDSRSCGSEDGYDVTSWMPSASRCLAFGTGLTFGYVGAKTNFQVDSSESDSGYLMVGVKGPFQHSVTEVTVTDTGDNLHEVVFEASLPGHYLITVKWNDKNIPGSPFMCNITYS